MALVAFSVPWSVVQILLTMYNYLRLMPDSLMALPISVSFS